MPSPLQAPEKELRFTRSGQAVSFWLLTAVCFSGAITWFACAWIWDLAWVWTLLPLAVGLAFLRVAIRLTRHAYLILSPIGLEVFPFFRPERGLQIVPWQEIESIEIDEANTLLTLHFNAARNAGMHLTLLPIHRSRRSLLAKAMSGRVSNSSASSETPPDPH